MAYDDFIRANLRRSLCRVGAGHLPIDADTLTSFELAYIWLIGAGDPGGRIMSRNDRPPELMELGAALEIFQGLAAARGTPVSISPEVFAAAAHAADCYGGEAIDGRTLIKLNDGEGVRAQVFLQGWRKDYWFARACEGDGALASQTNAA
jgi:hypothetical protein